MTTLLQYLNVYFQMKKLIIYMNNGIIQKTSQVIGKVKVVINIRQSLEFCKRLKRFQRERRFVYETICYVCIALAIAIKNRGCCRQCHLVNA